MTLNDLERQNKKFYGLLWRFRAATQVYIIHKWCHVTIVMRCR